MTSLSFFPPKDVEPQDYPNWGTGKKFGDRENIWIPKGPTWQYEGKPTEQYYQLTQLKLSNVRTNDQLLPSPQHSVMHNVLIDKPFPAEHPYSSHIERSAMFPKFDSPADPKRGAAARREMPKHAEMPAHPYECTIVSKTKGSGLRREIQQLPPESLKKPLEWNEEPYDHILKSPYGGKKTYYPLPPKTLVPNLADRSDSKCIRGNMEVGARTANATRNVERDQWDTTYHRNHTGLGPANPNALDNLDVKRAKDGEDDCLTPRSVRTFDPPRPMEGRSARALVHNPPPQTGTYPESRERNRTTPLTLHEREEERLWHGGKYSSLPQDTGPGGKHEHQQWRVQQDDKTVDIGLGTIQEVQKDGETLPYHPQVDAAAQPGEDYIEELGRNKHQEIQQMEATNRWKLLESEKPDHDITALRHKMTQASSKTQPFVFYGHEGKFQRERSGLYKTSYDPYKLQYSMNKHEMSGPGMFDITDVHKNALDNPLNINQDMHAILQYNRTLGGPPGSVAQLHDQPSQFEAFGPFEREKSLQKAHLQPNANTADVRTQEGGLVLRESTYGEGYNTNKFLQENQLPFYARNEPLIIMSHENHDLNHVRNMAIPNRSAGALGRSLQLETVPGFDISMVEEGRPATAPDEPTFSERYSYQWQLPQEEQNVLRRMGQPTKSNTNPKASRLQSRYITGNQFASKSSNIQPNGLSASWSPQSSYGSQFPSVHVDMSFKNDSRFGWKAGSGTPRPQTVLLDIQDSFKKSEARKRFHEKFRENGPDLRENITRGKKHQFGSFNAQVLRGTTLVEVA